MKYATLILCICATGSLLPVQLCVANEQNNQDTREMAPEDLKPYTEHVPKTLAKFDMVPIKGGKFIFSGDGKEQPREVEVKPFWIAKTECTWGEYETYYLQKDLPEDQRRILEDQRRILKGYDAIGRPSPPYGVPDHNWGRYGSPVLHTHYKGATKYCEWLSQKTGRKYRLPTEAEWEFACRGGEPDPQHKMDKNQVLEMAWVKDNSENEEHHGDNTTRPVATKKPNAFGLYDMLGNVGEWCVPIKGDDGVIRGGTYKDPAAKVSFRTRELFDKSWQLEDSQEPKSKWWLSNGPFCGFRVVREP